MRAIIGLGNPGKKYARNRHNIGYWVTNLVAQKLNLEFKRKTKCRSLVALKEDLLVAQPRTFMNLSGEAVSALKAAYRLKLEDILVISDDIYLPLETIRMRRSGSSGGHNGLLSIIEELRSSNFARLRVGINSAGFLPGMTLEDFVLSDFTKKEEARAKKETIRAAQAAITWLEDGIEKAMTRYN